MVTHSGIATLNGPPMQQGIPEAAGINKSDTEPNVVVVSSELSV